MSIYKAIIKARSAFPAIPKDAIIKKRFAGQDHHYATLENVLNLITPVLCQNGLCITQTVAIEENRFYVKTVLCHESGETLHSLFPMSDAISSTDLGAAASYARRYGLLLALGLAPEDDHDCTNEDKKETHQEPINNKEHRVSASEQLKAKIKELNQDTFSVGSYVVSFGKHKGKTLNDLGTAVVANYMSYLKRDAEEKKKPLSGGAKEFIEYAMQFLELPKHTQDQVKAATEQNSDFMFDNAPLPDEIPF